MPNSIKANTPFLHNGTVLFDSDWVLLTTSPSSTPIISGEPNSNKVNFEFIADLLPYDLNMYDIKKYITPIISVVTDNNEPLEYIPTYSQSNVIVTYPEDSNGWFYGSNKFQDSYELSTFPTQEELSGWHAGYISGMKDIFWTDDEEIEQSRFVTTDIKVEVEKYFHTIRQYSSYSPSLGYWQLIEYEYIVGPVLEKYYFKPYDFNITSTGITGHGTRYYYELIDTWNVNPASPGGDAGGPYNSNITITAELKQEVCEELIFAELTHDYLPDSLYRGHWCSSEEAKSEFSLLYAGGVNFRKVFLETSDISTLECNPPRYILTHPGDSSIYKNGQGGYQYLCLVIQTSIGDLPPGATKIPSDGIFLKQELPEGNIEFKFNSDVPSVNINNIINTPSKSTIYPVKIFSIDNPNEIENSPYTPIPPKKEIHVNGQFPIKATEKELYDTIIDTGFIETYTRNEEKRGYDPSLEEIEHELYNRYVGKSQDIHLRCQLVFNKDEIIDNTDKI